MNRKPESPKNQKSAFEFVSSQFLSLFFFGLAGSTSSMKHSVEICRLGQGKWNDKIIFLRSLHQKTDVSESQPSPVNFRSSRFSDQFLRNYWFDFFQIVLSRQCFFGRRRYVDEKHFLPPLNHHLDSGNHPEGDFTVVLSRNQNWLFFKSN